MCGRLLSATSASPLTNVSGNVNHELIAFRALEYRMQRIADSYTAARTDPSDIARLAVECGDPTVDAALRHICTTWVRHGLAQSALSESWASSSVDALFDTDTSLVDAIDDLIRSTHRVRFSRPRGGTISETPRHRPGIVNHRLQTS